MKVNLTGLISKIEENAGKQKSEKELTRERNSREMARYEHIIRPIAAKYGRDWCLTFDEVYSELCYKILTLGIESGWENLNESLVAKICYNRAVDVYRSAKRRWQRKAKEEAMMAENLEESHSKIGTPEEAEQLLLYCGFVELYSIGSRERNYLVIRLCSEGLIPLRYAEELGIEIPTGKLNDWEISQMLGLSPTSSSFSRMKKAIRGELEDYLRDNN